MILPHPGTYKQDHYPVCTYLFYILEASCQTVSVMDRDNLIAMYFRLGMSQMEIIICLASTHQVTLSQRQLQRVLKRMDLYRRKNMSDLVHVALYIVHCTDQLSKSGQLHGYRWMHLKCLHHGFTVTQETVRLLLQILDPAGVELRRRRRLIRRRYQNRGPNFTWHMDGYDKLKPYGICIHGCIDGYSRYIIWLKAYTTNNNPKVIAGYFMNAVEEHNKCPRRVRADRGTENGLVKELQTFLRRNHHDSMADEKSFIYGTSVTNQRIEAWWALLRKQCIQFWIELFAGMKHEGKYTGDFLDKNLIQFCFLRQIQVSNFTLTYDTCYDFCPN